MFEVGKALTANVANKALFTPCSYTLAKLADLRNGLTPAAIATSVGTFVDCVQDATANSVIHGELTGSQRDEIIVKAKALREVARKVAIIITIAGIGEEIRDYEIGNIGGFSVDATPIRTGGSTTGGSTTNTSSSASGTGGTTGGTGGGTTGGTGSGGSTGGSDGPSKGIGNSVNTTYCTNPTCAQIAVHIPQPGSHSVSCFSSLDTSAFYTYTTTLIDSRVCVYGYHAQKVWVTVDGSRSNTISWPSS